MDRISELPESIMQKIVFRLRTHEDAVRMSFVSKRWQSLWNSVPDYCFDFNSDTGEPISYFFDPEGRGRKRKRSATSIKHVESMMDELLSILHEHGDTNKKIINFFRLRGRVPTPDEACHVDRWIILVSRHFVKELHLQLNYVAELPRYRFPAESFDVGSLVVMSLSHCVLDKALLQEGRRFCCLKELRFSYVDMNGLAEDLLSRCPSLETLYFYRCPKIQRLQLNDLAKRIKTVTIRF